MMKHAGFLLALLVSLTGMAEAQAISLSRTQLRPTGTFSVSVESFAPGEAVQVWFGAELLQTAVVDEQGKGGPWPLSVPATTYPGDVLVGVASETSENYAEAPLKVTTPWAQYGYNQQRTRFNPHENILTASTVGSARRKWRNESQGPGDSAVTHRFLYKNQQINALDPATGVRLWSPGVDGSTLTASTSAAAVYGRVYTTTRRTYPVTAWSYYVFNQAPCGPAPSRCPAVATYQLAGEPSSPVAVDNGRVFLPAGDTLYAFPADCQGPSCDPLWTAPGAGPFVKNALAVWKDRVYVLQQGPTVGDVRHDVLAVYPTDCGEDGEVCAPLWQTSLGAQAEDGLAIAHNRLFSYLRAESAGTGRLTAFRDSCGQNGAPCRALWKSASLNRVSYPSLPVLAHGRAYAADGKTYDVDCRRDGGECTPLWRHGVVAELRGDLTMAGDVLFAVASGRAYGFDAHCSGGEPCAKIWSSEPFTGWVTGSATVSDGVIYVGGAGGYFYAFALRPELDPRTAIPTP